MHLKYTRLPFLMHYQEFSLMPDFIISPGDQQRGNK